MSLVSYARIRHAAHTGNGTGWDVEEWAFIGERDNPPAEVPKDAEYHVGFVANKTQFWIYARKAPLSPGFCNICQP